MIYVREDLRPLFAGERSVADFLRIEGDVYRESSGRRTLKFRRGGQDFFIKTHQGFGWGEILRKLATLHVPAVSARNEWRAIQALAVIGIDTMKLVAYGEEGLSPASRRSFVVTEALTGTESLEHWAPKFMESLRGARAVHLKHALIEKVAEIARRLHAHGLNHQDFYLCHMLLDLAGGEPLAAESLKLYLIDLHRMQIRKRTPRRWAIKDVAGVFFSAMDLDLTSTDLLRFVRVYGEKAVQHALTEERAFWQAVCTRALRVYRRHHNREPRVPAIVLRRVR